MWDFLRERERERTGSFVFTGVASIFRRRNCEQLLWSLSTIRMANKDTITSEERDHPVAVSSTSSLDSIFMGLSGNNEQQSKIATCDNNNTGHDAQQDSTSLEAQSAPPASNSSVISPSETLPGSVPGLVPSMMLPPNAQAAALPTTTGVPMTGSAPNHSIPEFLYQLTKMLTDDNKAIIEWSNGTYDWS